MKINSAETKYRQLNDFIRGEMRRKKIKQETVAKKLHIPRSSVSKRLSGDVDWLAKEIIVVFDLLGVDNNWNS